jgi:short-subunit dehydrogenase
MLERGDEGHVVNTASIAGLMGGAGIYGVTKQGVVALSESLYSDLKLSGAKIGVSVLCPGWVNTKIMDADRNRPTELANAVEVPSGPQMEAAADMIRKMLETGLSPAEVARQVVDAIRNDQLYILTHPEMDGLLRERFDNILARRNPTPRMLV